MVTFDERREVLTVQARDYAGRLDDTPHTYGQKVAQNGKNAGRASVKIDKPLREVIRSLLSPLEFYQRVADDAAIESNVRPGDKTSRKVWTPSPGDSLWRVIQDVCRLTGQVARFGPDGRLNVTAPATDDARFTITLPYGDLVEGLDLERDLNPWRRQRIRLQQLNEDTGEIVTAEYPADKTLDSVLAFPLTGTRSQAELRKLAESTFRQFERRQMRGRLTTRAALDRDDEPVYALRTGDRVVVPTRVRDETRALGLTVDELARELAKRGMTEANARSLAEGWQRADELAREFYVRRVSHRWEQETGYRATIDLGNYVQRVT